MAQRTGCDRPIGSAAMDGEPGTGIAALEQRTRTTLEELHTARDAYSEAIEAHAASERMLLRARREALEADAAAALGLERSQLETAISAAAQASRAQTGVVVADGINGAWPKWLAPKMQEAAAQCGPDEIPGVLLVRGLSGSTREADPATALVLDTTGRVSRPLSGLTASELARRRSSR